MSRSEFVVWSHLRAYKNGHLPDAGAVAQQSNRGWTILNLVDSFVSEAEAERMEEISKKNNR